MIDFKKFKSGEHCAYEVAHFKKKVDKKLHNTGSIDDMFSEFDSHSDVCKEATEGMNKFKERIRYYYTHENATPPKHPDHGSSQIYEGYMQEYENNPYKAMAIP